MDAKAMLFRVAPLVLLSSACGALGFSMFLPLTFVGVMVYHSWHREKAEKRRYNARVLREAHIASNLRRLEPKLPTWVQFPDTEKCRFLSDMLVQLWPYAKVVTENTVQTSVNTLLQKMCPSFLSKLEISKCDLGHTAPAVSGVNTVIDDDGRELYLDLKLKLSGDNDVVVTAGALDVQLRDLEVTTIMRITFAPFSEEIPCFSAICISMLSAPQVDFTKLDAGRLSLSTIPGLNSFLEDLISNSIAQSMVWPRRIAVPLAYNDMNEYNLLAEKLADISYEGVVRVKIISAKGLKNVDYIGKSDPYCVCHISGIKKKTKVKKNTTDPKWDEQFEWLVAAPRSQELRLCIKDDDIAANKVLGQVEIDFLNLAPNKPQLIEELPLERGTGTVTLEIVYKPFIEREPMVPTLVGNEWDPRNTNWYNGYLFVGLKRLFHMSNKKGTKVSFAVIDPMKTEGKDKEMKTSYEQLDFQGTFWYNEDFQFPLNEINNKKLLITVTGGNKATLMLDITKDILTLGTAGSIKKYFFDEGEGEIVLGLGLKYVDPTTLRVDETEHARSFVKQGTHTSVGREEGASQSIHTKTPDRLKAVLLHGAGFLMGSYFVGWALGFFSIIRLLLDGALSYVYAKDCIAREATLRTDNRRGKINWNANDMTPEEAAKLRQLLPPWMYSPSVEKTEWLNEWVATLWPYLRLAINKTVMDSTNPMLKDMKSVLDVLELDLDLGEVPPLIAGVSHYTRHQQGEQVMLDIDLRWAGNTKAVVKLGKGPVGVNAVVDDVAFSAILRVVLKPLTASAYPCFEGMDISFLNTPEIDFEASFGVLPVTSLPGVKQIVTRIISQSLNSMLVWPICLDPRIAILEPTGRRSALDIPCEGLLRVTVTKAVDLRNAEGMLGTSDPYVSVILNESTPVKHKTPVISNNLNPIWTEGNSFEFMPSGEDKVIAFMVKDSDRVSANVILGEYATKISALPPNELVEAVFPLRYKGKQKGSLYATLEWLPFSPEPAIVPSVRNFATGLAFVHVIQVTALPGSPDAYATLVLGNSKVKTQTINGANPVFDKLLIAPITNTASQRFTVEVRSDTVGKDERLGELSFSVNELIDSGGVQDQWDLEKAVRSSNPKIDLRIEIRTVQPHDPARVPLTLEDAIAKRKALDEALKAQVKKKMDDMGVPAVVDAGPKKPRKSLATLDPEALQAAREEEEQAARVAQKTLAAVTGEADAAVSSRDFDPAAISTMVVPHGKGDLIVTVVSASNLPRANVKNGYSDPYVSIHVGKQKQKTRYLERTLDPVWENPQETLIFSGIQKAEEAVMEVHVKDHEKYFLKNQPLGIINIPVSSARELEFEDTWELDTSECQYDPLVATDPSTVVLRLRWQPEIEATTFGGADEAPKKKGGLSMRRRKQQTQSDVI